MICYTRLCLFVEKAHARFFKNQNGFCSYGVIIKRKNSLSFRLFSHMLSFPFFFEIILTFLTRPARYNFPSKIRIFAGQGSRKKCMFFVINVLQISVWQTPWRFDFRSRKSQNLFHDVSKTLFSAIYWGAAYYLHTLL